MAKARKSSKKSSGGRGSAEAIEKRRVARQLNTLLTEGGSSSPKLDGRTESAVSASSRSWRKASAVRTSSRRKP